MQYSRDFPENWPWELPVTEIHRRLKACGMNISYSRVAQIKHKLWKTGRLDLSYGPKYVVKRVSHEARTLALTYTASVLDCIIDSLHPDTPIEVTCITDLVRRNSN